MRTVLEHPAVDSEVAAGGERAEGLALPLRHAADDGQLHAAVDVLRALRVSACKQRAVNGPLDACSAVPMCASGTWAYAQDACMASCVACASPRACLVIALNDQQCIWKDSCG